VECVGDLKIAIADTTGHRLMVGGGRAIENFKVAKTISHVKVGLIIGINPNQNRGACFTELQNIKLKNVPPNSRVLMTTYIWGMGRNNIHV
jgi:hypothetical protein